MQMIFESFSGPVFKALALSLLSSLWQAAIVFGAVYLLLAINKNATSRFKYNLAAFGGLVITFWFVQTFVHQLHLQNTLSNAFNEQAEMLFYSGTMPLLSPTYSVEAGAVPFQLSRFIPLALCIYFMGMLIMTAKVIFGYFQVQALKSKGLFTPPEALMEHLQQATESLNILHNVRLFLSDRVTVPVMIGYVKPVILLPLTITSHLSIAQIEAIITHELAHIRRQDYLINFIQSILEALFFFNPFVWLLSGVMREEREKACDEIVVGTVPAYTYASALLALEKINIREHLILAANGHKSFKLLTRIKHFTMKKDPITTIRQKALSVLLIILAIGCIAWLSPDQPKPIRSKRVPNPPSPPTVLQLPAPLPSGAPAVVPQPASDTAPKKQVYIYTNKDSTPADLKKQIDKIIHNSTSKMILIGDDFTIEADSIFYDKNGEALKAIRLLRDSITNKFIQDTAWKVAIKTLAGDAKLLSENFIVDSSYDDVIRSLAQRARELAKSHYLSRENQAQIKKLQDKSRKLILKFQRDTAWKVQLDKFHSNVQKFTDQLNENPELTRNFEKMADAYRELAEKIMSDSKYMGQIKSLEKDLEDLNFDSEND